MHSARFFVMGDAAAALCDQLFVDVGAADGDLPSDADDIFSILETWEDDCVFGGGAATQLSPRAVAGAGAGGLAIHGGREDGDDDGSARSRKRQKVAAPPPLKTSHITVERNRRKQMNEHLAVLRSLMPCFYVKRGDQASIIGGVVDYIKELQQLLQSLEAKKQRKAYADQVLSPRPPPSCSPRPPLPKYSTPPLSPRLAVPISPRTPPPTPGSPYMLRPLPGSSTYVSPAMTPTHEPASSYLNPSLDAIAAELSAYANKQVAPPKPPPAGLLPDVRVEFAGANLVLKTVSLRAPGQAVRIISALEGRSLEILHAKISTVDDTAVNSFTVKIGIECELSAEELVQEIQQTFSLRGTN